MTLGNKIYTLRMAKMLSQEAFAELFDVSRQTVSKWENDVACPEVEKLIAISLFFGVSTDYLLLDKANDTYGIFSSDTAVLAETEQFALLLEQKENILSAKLYKGIATHKNLIAVCEETEKEKSLSFAYLTESAEPVCYGEKPLAPLLGTPYDITQKSKMYHTERICMESKKEPLPTVSEVGIRASLAAWRSGTIYRAHNNEMFFILYTKNEELVFIYRQKTTMFTVAHHKTKYSILGFSRECNISAFAIMPIIPFPSVFLTQASRKKEKM